MSRKRKDTRKHGSPTENRTRPEVLWLLIAVLIGTTLYAYWPITSHGAVGFDDPRYVTENEVVLEGLSARGLGWALTSRHAYNWHPLTWLSHMIDVELFDLDLGRHHLVSLLMHATSAVVLLLLLMRWTGALWSSSVVAALFALHPVHVESVAWLSERKDVLSALLFLLTLLAYARYVERSSAARYGVLLGTFILGLLAKPMLVTLPFVLLLLDLWPLRRWEIAAGLKVAPRLLLEKLPLLLLAAGSSGLTLWAQRPIVQDLESYSFGERIGNAAISYVAYLGSFFWPMSLAIFYPHPEAGLSWSRVAAACAILAAISGITLWQLRPRPFLFVGWFWYLGTLVPVIGLVQVGLQARADRYTYLPTIGLSIALCWLLAELGAKRRGMARVSGVLLAALLATLVPLTRNQAATWRDDTALFTQALEVTEDNYWAAYNLGLSQMKLGEKRAARAAFERALEVEPDDVESLRNLGQLLAEMGEAEEALVLFERAVALRPGDRFAGVDLGRIYVELGRGAEALVPLTAATELAPDDPEVAFLLGSAYLRLGRRPKALEALRRAEALRPDHAPTHNAIGIVLAQEGRLEDAVPHFRRAIELDPGSVEAGNNLQAALAAVRGGRQ